MKSGKRQRSNEEVEDTNIKKARGLDVTPDDKEEETFPSKLMNILDNDRNYMSIRWSQDGIVFAIQQESFEARIMGQHFPNARFSSFVRRLSRWGFERSVRAEFSMDWIVYRHPLFQRGKSNLLKNLTSGQMYDINGLQEETGDSMTNETKTNLANSLIALGSECRVASLPRDHISPAQCVAEEFWQTKMGHVLGTGNDEPNLDVLRSQNRNPLNVPRQGGHPNTLFVDHSSLDSVLNGPSASLSSIHDTILNRFSNDQVAHLNSHIDKRRLLALLQSLDRPITETVFCARPAVNPLIQSILLAALDLIQRGRQSSLPYSHLSDEELIRYLLFTQIRR
ncbi:hypothetical protein FisN_33Lh045 [Fistulifera solaris]|uniref:HSF-type DNA-binding domain-containing protein n=1 Tax=Fistulifera solaris TaxID=1519565 RepID=A0A1Z5KA82_FISSO|nr:hypothetical protein FisN_33Lh045 [Fistulifera solaris]|eukprot:GAX23154.1 hypothetical protein FisN_33Lh045 [Fistulifera solaris]